MNIKGDRMKPNLYAEFLRKFVCWECNDLIVDNKGNLVDRSFEMIDPPADFSAETCLKNHMCPNCYNNFLWDQHSGAGM